MELIDAKDRRFHGHDNLSKHIEKHLPSTGMENKVVVADLDGTLLRSPNAFPYFLLVAFEGGSWLRALVLLVLYPVACLLHGLVSESLGIQILIFLSCAGLKLRVIESVARAVLPKFYAEDVHPESWRVFSSFGKKYVVTECPRIMVEMFAQNQLGADKVLGTELEVTATGRCTGFAKSPGVLVGVCKKGALKAEFCSDLADLGIGDQRSDFDFLSICKEMQFVARTQNVEAVPMHSLFKPVIFHDGRLVQRPTPLVALFVVMWMPLGLLLSVLRLLISRQVPWRWSVAASRFLGVQVRVKGNPAKGSSSGGVMFVCSHRTLLDPVFIAMALGRSVTAFTYSLSRVSEVLSPIKTVRLSRDHEEDLRKMKEVMEGGDVVVCPEGTTSREAILLRFSALFTEVTDKIVPVAVESKAGMFHGTSACGCKAMDLFFFLMNPRPAYHLSFLEQLPPHLTCGAGGRSREDVANHVQQVIAAHLGFQCSTFTRRDKYRLLAGHDGSVPIM